MLASSVRCPTGCGPGFRLRRRRPARLCAARADEADEPTSGSGPAREARRASSRCRLGCIFDTGGLDVGSRYRLGVRVRVRACACACARVRACVRACMRVRLVRSRSRLGRAKAGEAGETQTGDPPSLLPPHFTPPSPFPPALLFIPSPTPPFPPPPPYPTPPPRLAKGGEADDDEDDIEPVPGVANEPLHPVCVCVWGGGGGEGGRARLCLWVLAHVHEGALGDEAPLVGEY